MLCTPVPVGHGASALRLAPRPGKAAPLGRHLQPTRAAVPPGGSNGVPSSVAAAPVTDASVPEGHRGLHGFLYGEGGAEAHETDGGYEFQEVSPAHTCRHRGRAFRG